MKAYQDIIFNECMKANGFASLIKENIVDELKFKKLIEAIQKLTTLTSTEYKLDKLTVACLFEFPWEIENTVEHYSKQSKDLGKKVSSMADELRESTNEFLWNGLDDKYKVTE